jgi:hypothetical protein
MRAQFCFNATSASVAQPPRKLQRVSTKTENPPFREMEIDLGVAEKRVKAPSFRLKDGDAMGDSMPADDAADDADAADFGGDSNADAG